MWSAAQTVLLKDMPFVVARKTMQQGLQGSSAAIAGSSRFIDAFEERLWEVGGRAVVRGAPSPRSPPATVIVTAINWL